MPELPEVETIARTLAPQICGQRITETHVLLPKALQAGASHLPRVKDAVIEKVFRRAKLLLVSLRPDRGDASFPELLLVFHLKMTGRFFVHPHGTPPLKHTRLIFDLERAGRLFFDDMRTFGYCRVQVPEELAVWPFWTALGPEPLDMTPEALAAHFALAFSRRRAPVKALLLDQEVVAGIGNIYADEALFRAGIHPGKQADSVPEERLLPLARGLQDILRQSIQECGSSIRDYRDALGNAGAFQNAFSVYGRGKEHCLSCGAPLESVRIAGRGTVFCPRCQK